VHKLDKRVQNFESKFDETPTADQFQLLVAVYAGWRITDPTAFFPKFAGGSVAEAERALQEIIRAAKSEVVGQHPLGDFISVNEKDLKFTQVEKEVLDRVQSRLETNNYGVKIEFLGIKKLGFPESVTDKVFDRMSKERDVLISAIDGEGNVRAAAIRVNAERDAAKIVSDAEGQALRIRGEAESKAAESLQVMNQEPELAKFLMHLTGLESFLRDRTTLVLDENTLPLFKQRQSSPRTNTGTPRSPSNP
jgi:membrane protease subunit HflC